MGEAVRAFWTALPGLGEEEAAPAANKTPKQRRHGIRRGWRARGLLLHMLMPMPTLVLAALRCDECQDTSRTDLRVVLSDMSIRAEEAKVASMVRQARCHLRALARPTDELVQLAERCGSVVSMDYHGTDGFAFVVFETEAVRALLRHGTHFVHAHAHAGACRAWKTACALQLRQGASWGAPSAVPSSPAPAC